jgi:hypothetical protein
MSGCHCAKRQSCLLLPTQRVVPDTQLSVPPSKASSHASSGPSAEATVASESAIVASFGWRPLPSSEPSAPLPSAPELDPLESAPLLEFALSIALSEEAAPGEPVCTLPPQARASVIHVPATSRGTCIPMAAGYLAYFGVSGTVYSGAPPGRPGFLLRFRSCVALAFLASFSQAAR